MSENSGERGRLLDLGEREVITLGEERFRAWVSAMCDLVRKEEAAQPGNPDAGGYYLDDVVAAHDARRLVGLGMCIDDALIEARGGER